MKTPDCPPAARLSRAFSLGIDDELAAHLAGCASCAAEWAALGELRRLGRALPFQVPQSEQREQLRASLLAAAALAAKRPGGRRGGWALAAAAIVLLAIGLGLVLWTHNSADRTVVVVRSTRHGAIRPQGAARFHELGGPPDEIVRLVEGTIVAEVTPLRSGERFRVTAGDAEVEVRGTAFEATAYRDHLARVRVLHGVVEVRPLGGIGAAQRLEAGAVWQAPSAAGAQAGGQDLLPAPGAAASHGGGPAGSAEEGPSAAGKGVPDMGPALAGSRQQGPGQQRLAASGAERQHGLAGALATPQQGAAQGGAAPPRAATASAAERAFGQGWAALRDRDYETAAAAFDRSALLGERAGGGRTIAEDAVFWRAVALARAGRGAEAITGLRGFVRSYPASARAGEAWSILGWLLYDRKDLAGAGRCFERASQDPAAEVRQSARSGLSAIAGQRGE